MNAPATAAAVAPVQISAAEYHEIPLSTIQLSNTSLQVLRRKRFTKESLAELTADVRARGVMEPILVRPLISKEVGVKYELVFGERRLLASREAGRAHVPALIRPMTDVELIGAQFAENMEREGYHELEEAQGYRLLCQAHKCDAKSLVTSGIVAKNEAHVHARLKLLDLCAEVCTDFYAGKVNASIALLISRIRDPKLQQQALKGCLTGKGLGKFIGGSADYEGPLTFIDAKAYIDQEFIVYQDGAAAIEEARKKGLPTKGIAETKDTWKREYAPPAGHIFVEDVKAKIGDAPAGAVLMQNPHTGEAKLVLKKEKAIALFKEKKVALPQDLKPRQNFMGSRSSSGGSSKAPDAAAEAKAQAKREREARERQLKINIQVATFKAVRAKTPAKLGKEELLAILDALPHDVDGDIAPRPKSLANCTERDLIRFILDEIYGGSIGQSWCYDEDIKKLLAAAKRYGVNAAAIAKDLTEEFEEEEAALLNVAKVAAGKPAKAAKKKASKK